MKEIEDFIKSGMEKAYRECLVLKISWENLQSNITEYLFTINVAQYLIEWNEKSGWFYSINLEFDALTFLNDAFLSQKTVSDNPNDIFSEQKFECRQNHSLTRTGRIDIAINKSEYQQMYEQFRSIYPIEIKGINQPQSEIFDDILRICELVSEQDSISENSIIKGFSVFIKRLDSENKIFTENDFTKKRDDYIKNLRQDIIDTFKYSNLNIDTEYFDIYKHSVEEYVNNSHGEEIDYSELKKNTGAVIGILVTISRNK
jgi:hypothetical protein